ncbi:MAG: hypothetical protein ACXWQO_10950 [Bdellovibrionota bacterium]
MKNIRQLHLYLGCLFAPLIIYFSISGMWQVFRLHDLPEDTSPTTWQVMLHEASKPHTHSTLPGRKPKEESVAKAFNWIAVAMAIGMTISSLLGILLALRFSKRPALPVLCLVAGIAIPVLFLYFA